MSWEGAFKNRIGRMISGIKISPTATCPKSRKMFVSNFEAILNTYLFEDTEKHIEVLATDISEFYDAYIFDLRKFIYN